MNCNAVDPLTKSLTCTREAMHPLAHKAVHVDDEGGRTTVEWYDTSQIRKHLDRLRQMQLHREEQSQRP